MNSWAAGQRETAAPIDAILHELQAHNTTRGAAGPTAGQPQEDLQDGKGAGAMGNTRDAIAHERRDHEDDAQPPKYAESGVTGSGYRLTDGRQEQRQATPMQSNEVEGVPLGNLPSARLNATQPRPLTFSETLRERREALTTPLTARQKTRWRRWRSPRRWR